MTTNKKLGFGGEWIEVFPTGRHIGITDDGRKIPVEVDLAFLEAAASNYDSGLHEAPATIGHPEHDAPAYGWVAGTRVAKNSRGGHSLEVQFAQTDPDFESMVRGGRLKKRSPKFYLDDEAPGGKPPYIRHVAFLGAMPPSVKGMRDVQHVQFGEDEGKGVTFEIEFSEGEPSVIDKKTDKPISEQIADYFREKFGSKEDKSAANVSFSEADARTLIEAAVKPLTDEITSLKTENAELKTQVAGIGTKTSRAELVSFCEALESDARLPRSFRKLGGIEFLEVLASVPTEKKVATIEFAEAGKPVEIKTEISALDFMKNWMRALPPYVQFGEAFGGVRLKGSGADVLDPQSVEDKKTLRAAMGVNDPEAASKRRGAFTRH